MLLNHKIYTQHKKSDRTKNAAVHLCFYILRVKLK